MQGVFRKYILKVYYKKKYEFQKIFKVTTNSSLIPLEWFVLFGITE